MKIRLTSTESCLKQMPFIKHTVAESAVVCAMLKVIFIQKNKTRKKVVFLNFIRYNYTQTSHLMKIFMHFNFYNGQNDIL